MDQQIVLESQSEKIGKSPLSIFKPLEKTVRSSQLLANEIRKLIVQGKIKPGETLPPERDMAKSFQVTRPTVREALRSLEQLRLVSIRQGSGITVRNYLTTAGIEFVADLLLGAGNNMQSLMRDISEAWWVIGRAMMFYAVEQYRKEHEDFLLEAIMAYLREASSDDPEPRRLQELDYEVQNRLMHGTGNQAMILLHNSMRHIYSHVATLFEPIVENPIFISNVYSYLMHALDKGDTQRAKEVFAEYFDHGKEALARAGNV